MKSRRYILGALFAVSWIAPLHMQAQTGTIRGRSPARGLPAVSGVTVSFGPKSTQTLPDGRFVLAGSRRGTTRSGKADRVLTAPGPLTGRGGPDGRRRHHAARPGHQPRGNRGDRLRRAARRQHHRRRHAGVGRRSSTPAASSAREELIQSKVAGRSGRRQQRAGRRHLDPHPRHRPRSTRAASRSIVIDGVPIGTGAGGGLSAGRNPLNFLNPNDIETITVLRDASAAAIYGANAANGVVLITDQDGTRRDAAVRRTPAACPRRRSRGGPTC